MKHVSKVLALVLCLVSTSALATPSITIGGLDGAQHWVWVEAESRFEGGTDVYVGDVDISNTYQSPNAVLASYQSPNDWLKYDITIPAAMSNPTIYIKAGCNNGQEIYAFFDGTNVGYAYPHEGSDYNPWWFTKFTAGANMSAIEAGDMEFWFTLPGRYNLMKIDGFYICDGDLGISDNQVGYSANYSIPETTRYLNADHKPTTVPLLAGSSYIPTLTVTGAGAVEYLLDGADYTPGTAIGEGVHYLEIIAFAADGSVSMAGANFEIVPEPATLTLIGLGALGLIRRKK